MSVFKQCTVCEDSWESMDDVLNDKEMVFCGYQPFFQAPEKSLLLFVHEKEGCGTTIGFRLTDFKSILKHDMNFKAFEPGAAADCEGHCLNTEDLSTCNSKTCPGVSVRELIQVIKAKSS